MAHVHPSAHVHSSAELAADVEVGPGAVVGPGVVVGAGTRIRAGAHVVENTTLGAGNDVHPGAVLGGDPQDLKFDRDADAGSLVIGDRNVFREGSTVNRGSGEAGPTRVGDGCYLMACAHVAHNTRVGNRVILGHSAALAGHSTVGDGCILSAYASVHQFTDVGEMAFFQGYGGATQHAPPFTMIVGINGIAGLNRVGLRRSGRFTSEEIDDLKALYRALFRRRAESSLEAAVAAAERRTPTGPSRIMLEFIRRALEQAPPRRRGVCGPVFGGSPTDSE